MTRVLNFSAGPAVLPEEVLAQAAAETYLEACLDEAKGDAAFIAKALGELRVNWKKVRALQPLRQIAPLE